MNILGSMHSPQTLPVWLRVLDKLAQLPGDKKRSKIIGHEAIHLVLLVDALLDDYTRSWESGFAVAFPTPSVLGLWLPN